MEPMRWARRPRTLPWNARILRAQMQDAFALRSHQRAIAAIDSGKFAEEILPVPIPQKKGNPVFVTTDERPRRDTTIEIAGEAQGLIPRRRNGDGW